MPECCICTHGAISRASAGARQPSSKLLACLCCCLPCGHDCRYATANYAIGWAVAPSLQGPYTKPGGPWLSSINTNANGDVRSLSKPQAVLAMTTCSVHVVTPMLLPQLRVF